MMVRPTQSSTVYIQAVGRGLRTYPGKENCLILDFVPTSNKTLLTGNALLEGKPKAQKAAEDKALQQGTILEVIGIDAQGNGIDADPDTVVMQALDLLSVQPMAWTFDGKVATAGGGASMTRVIVGPHRRPNASHALPNCAPMAIGALSGIATSSGCLSMPSTWSTARSTTWAARRNGTALS